MYHSDSHSPMLYSVPEFYLYVVFKIMHNTVCFCRAYIIKNDALMRTLRKHVVFEKWRHTESQIQRDRHPFSQKELQLSESLNGILEGRTLNNIFAKNQKHKNGYTDTICTILSGIFEISDFLSIIQ